MTVLRRTSLRRRKWSTTPFSARAICTAWTAPKISPSAPVTLLVA